MLWKKFHISGTSALCCSRSRNSHVSFLREQYLFLSISLWLVIRFSSRRVIDLEDHAICEVWVATLSKEAGAFKGGSVLFKMLQFMQPGGSPERRVFKEPYVQPNQFAIQIHRDSLNAVMATFQLNRLDECVMLGAESRRS